MMLVLSLVILLINLCGSSAFLRARLTPFANHFGSSGSLQVLRPLRIWATLPVNTDTNTNSKQLTYTEIIASKYQVDETDYEKLEPDDPRFVRMEIPRSRGPLADAYKRHMRWRHSLGTQDLSRWAEWAVTTLYSNAHPDQYNLHDFVAQNLQRELYANVLKELKKNDTEAVVEFSSLAYKFEQSHIDDVQKALKSYYTAFNSRNCATIRSCWLQDPSTELILPGFAKARGGHKVDQLYQHFLKSFRSGMGHVKAQVSAVHVRGNMAVAHTVEEVGERPDNFTLERLKIKASQVVKPRVLATTIMRRVEDRWFILCHHAVRMGSSPFTGDELEIRFTPEDARQRAAKMAAFLAPLEAGAGAVDGGEAAGVTPEALEKLERQAVQDPRDTSELSCGPVKAATGTNAAPATAQGAPKAKSSSRSPKTSPQAPPTAVALTTEAFVPSATEGDVAHSGSSDVPGAKSSSSTTPSPQNPQSTSEASPLPKVVDTVLADGTQVLKEKGDKLGIDPSQPLSKQTVQALKLLVKQGRITNEEKDVLIADLVSGLTNNGPSAVQVAYEMLCGPATALKGTVDMDMVAHLSDFADQCGVLLLSRRTRVHESRREEDKKDDAKSC